MMLLCNVYFVEKKLGVLPKQKNTLVKNISHSSHDGARSMQTDAFRRRKVPKKLWWTHQFTGRLTCSESDTKKNDNF